MRFVAAPWFSTSLSIFAIETLLALYGAQLPSWWDVLQLS